MSRSKQYFRNHRQEKALTQSRIIASAVFVLVLMFALTARFFYLQVLQFDRYKTKADDNRVLLMTAPPPRGLIYDRHGVVLADNRPIHSLTIVPERIEDMSWLEVELSQAIDISPDEWQAFKNKLQEYRRPYQSITLKSQLTDEQWAKIAVDLHKWDGVQVEAQLTRYYPFGEAFAHAIGYVGRINTNDLESLDRLAYQGTQFIGKSGIEDFYESSLFGKPGPVVRVRGCGPCRGSNIRNNCCRW